MATLIQLKQIESSSFLIQAAALAATFTQSVKDVVNIIGTISSSAQITALGFISESGASSWETITGIPSGLISSSTQLDGTTLKNITISTADADHYSLIVSGALAIVDATNLSGSIDGDEDTMVPGQIYLVSGSIIPSDPYVSGSEQSNIIDQGEW